MYPITERDMAYARKRFWAQKREEAARLETLIASTEQTPWFKREYAERYGSY